MSNYCLLLAVAAAVSVPVATAQTVTLREVGAVAPGREVGTVTFRDGPHGLLVEPRLHGLGAGPHAAHVHGGGSCAATEEHPGQRAPAGGAGDHYDPDHTNRHAGPYGDGHRGDLPNLLVEQDGSATITMLAPRLKAQELRGRALIIHAGADRYDAHAAHAHGTGGARSYCGIIR